MRVRELLECVMWLMLAAAALTVSAALAQGGETKLIDFHADWCQPCKAMAPVVDALIRDGYVVERVNIDANREMATRFGVGAVPCFVVVEQGREVDRVVGVVQLERLKLNMRKPPAPARDSMSRAANPQSRIPNPSFSAPHPAWRYERPVGHRQAVVRIFVQDNGQTRSIGSGVLVRWSGRIVVLTARHVIKDAKGITVRLVTGKKHWARPLSVDATWDCAVLELTGKPEGVEPAAIELGPQANQKDGDRLESCGYGPDGKLAVNTGLFLGYRRSTAALNGPDDWMVISGRAREGDSGGPVFNARGRVVGVLWGTDGQEVVCVQAGRIHANLEIAVKKLRQYEQRGDFVNSHAPLVPVAAPIQRNPTPPMSAPCDPSSGCCPVGPVAATNVDYLLPYRQGQAAKEASADRQLERIEATLQQIQGQMVTNANQPPAAMMPAPAPQPTKPATDDEELSLRERIKARLEGQPGFLGKFWQKIDNLEHIWVIIAVVGLFILWKKGGIHTIVERKREKLEEDAEGDGFKARLAQRLLNIHDGPIGQKLADFEARLAHATAKADAAAKQATTASDQAVQIALATPTAGQNPTQAAATPQVIVAPVATMPATAATTTT